MGLKFSYTPVKNAKGGDWYLDLDRATNKTILTHFRRFGILGCKELDLLLSLHKSTIYQKLEKFRAQNNGYIDYVHYQKVRKSRLWSTDLFYELTDAGKLECEKRGIPNYEPPAGADFEHRAMSVRWAVSLYAGAAADTAVRQIEWPEIKARLSPKAIPSATVHNKQIRTDWTPTGFERGIGYQFSRGPEIDCGTESHFVIRNKIITHSRIVEAGLHESQLGLLNDFIPFVTVSETRKQNILQDIADLISEGEIKKKHASLFGVSVFPYFGSKEPLDTRAYTTAYERVGFPDFFFNQ